jgi:hypothetical protein
MLLHVFVVMILGTEVFCVLAAVYSVLCLLCRFVIYYRRVLVDHPKGSEER